MDVQIDTYPLGGKLTGVSLRGEIDVASGSTFKERLYALVNDHVHVAVNLCDVTYIDSSGLAMMLALQKRLRERDGTLCLVTDNKHQLKLFALTGIDSAIPVFPNDQAAIQQASARIS